VVKTPPTYRVVPESSSAFTALLPTLGFQLVAVPVEVLMAARRFRVVEPFTVVKTPPTYRVVPESSRAFTALLPTLGFQLVTVLVDVFTAARRLRVTRFAMENAPPR
jgi:hypothetical protein